MTTSKEEQEKLDAVLDAALDDLDDDDDDEFLVQQSQTEVAPPPTTESKVEGEEKKSKATPQTKKGGTTASCSSSGGSIPQRPVHGPLPPPSSPLLSGHDNDAMGSIDEMMKQIMMMQQQQESGSGGGGEEEFLGRLLQKMQGQISAELEQIEKESSCNDNTLTTKTSSATKTTTPPKKPNNKNNEKQQQQQQQQQSAGGEGGVECDSTSSQKESRQQPSNDNNDVDQAISSLIEGVANQAKLDGPNMMNNNDNDEDEDEMLKNMINQLGEGLMMGGGGMMGGGDIASAAASAPADDFNADALIDGMMEQLLAKDLMYEPMKKVAEKFPDWLQQNKEKLSQEEYDKRRQQYQCFQKLVHTYDTEPENVQLLMLLMQEVQEFGQPPPEIIQDIAPGLELDEDGLPKMDGAAAGGGGGLPFPPNLNGGDDEECRIM